MAPKGIVVRHNGLEYTAFKSVRVTRSIESIAGSFELTLSDPRPNSQTTAGKPAKPFPFRQGDRINVGIGDDNLIFGYIDKRSFSLGVNEHSISIAGRDRVGALMVDNSANIGGWHFPSMPLFQFIGKITAPFSISLSMDGATAKALASSPQALRYSIDVGESCFEVIDKYCRLSGVLPVSDGQGGLILTRAGSKLATDSLGEGDNILSASAAYDSTGRYHTYVITGQRHGTDNDYGLGVVAVTGKATDEGIASERMLILHADTGLTPALARAKAAWTASVRAGKAATYTVKVQGWRQSDGSLWRPNIIVGMKAPSLDLIDTAQLLLVSVEYSLDDSSGTTATLTLRPLNAYAPEPTIITKGAAWDEISRGVK